MTKMHLASKVNATMNVLSRRGPVIAVLLAVLLIMAGCGGTTPTQPQPPTSAPIASSTPRLMTAPPRASATYTPAVKVTSLPNSATNTPVPSTSSWLTVYFTDPTTIDKTRSNGFDRVIVEAIGKAKRSIDIASFDFNLKSVIDALTAAQKRGVSVRLVLDLEQGSTTVRAVKSQNVEAYEALDAIKKARLPYVDGGRSTGLMHNKIVIIDGEVVFAGSWNLSFNDTFKNENNILRITDPTIIINYQAKFNEMYENKRFGRKAVVAAPLPNITVAGTQVDMYFAPTDDVMPKVVAEVNKARRSIRFMIFTFTYPDLSAAMIERAGKGVQVEGVIETRGASQGALPDLYCANIPVKRDGGGGTMHHKVIIIDNAVVITGSFNFTKSATTQNDENLLIIRNKDVAQAYLAAYERVMARAETPEVDCGE